MKLPAIQLPKIWGQGSLFASSGLDTNTTWARSLVGTLLGDAIGVEFKTPVIARLRLMPRNMKNLEFTVITSDLICGVVTAEDGEKHDLILTFTEENAVRVRTCAQLRPRVDFDEDMERREEAGAILYTLGNERFCVIEHAGDKALEAAFAYGEGCADAARRAMACDIAGEAERKLAFYERLPRPDFRDAEEEMLYYKCFSVMRCMVYSPEGRYTTRWTTPDRYPHKDCWLWDSAFHVAGLRHISPDLAEDAIRAVLLLQHDNGYIPHEASVDEDAAVTQPPVLAWAVYELYKESGDTSFAGEVFDKLAAYLTWDMENRDNNHNGLLEYAVNETSVTNRCDESGMDNSPRFDGEGPMDCIDFSCFFANDARCLSRLAGALGRKEEEAYWQSRFEETRQAINALLWDEEEQFYFDRRMDGTFCRVKSVASFLPLFAGICDEERARQLVRHLDDPREFGTPFPIPTVSADDPTYPTLDMFRGPVWLNFNYIIAQGLEAYGFADKARFLRESTIEQVKKWYLSDGVIYEFYDSRDKVSPRRLSRKGNALQPYLPDVRVQCVRDFSWGSCLVPDMIIGRADAAAHT